MGFDWGGSWLLPRLVGLRKAKELAFFGGRIYGPEAEAIGLINRVVPADDHDAFVAEWAAELAESAPLALTMLKEELHLSSHPPFTAMIGLETYGQIAQRSTADATEGFQSFLEKRPARFEGL
jgi:2-(1,2-epoxy-1,2-dihydrophenyl)acetyl-CoA isomerase